MFHSCAFLNVSTCWLFDWPSCESLGQLELVIRCGFSSLFLASFGSFEWRKVIRLAGLPWPLSRTTPSQRSTKHGRLRSPCIVLLSLALLSDSLSLPLDGHDADQTCTNTFFNALLTSTIGSHIDCWLSCELFECWFRCSGFAKGKWLDILWQEYTEGGVFRTP